MHTWTPASGAEDSNNRKSREGTRHFRVLVAEDNAVNQMLVTHMLAGRGHSVVITENGCDAVSHLEHEAFDLVLMDVQMPRMDGLKATEIIRSNPKALIRNIPIVAMTAHAMKGDRERCLATGMNGYLAKPISEYDLFAIIDAVIPLETEIPEREAPVTADTLALDSFLDLESVLERCGGNRELVRNIALIGLQDCSSLVADIQSAIRKGDAEELRTAGHALKGMVSHFGTDCLTKTAYRLEMIGRDNLLDESHAVFTELEKQVEEMLRELQKIVDGRLL